MHVLKIPAHLQQFAKFIEGKYNQNGATHESRLLRYWFFRGYTPIGSHILGDPHATWLFVDLGFLGISSIGDSHGQFL